MDTGHVSDDLSIRESVVSSISDMPPAEPIPVSKRRISLDRDTRFSVTSSKYLPDSDGDDDLPPPEPMYDVMDFDQRVSGVKRTHDDSEQDRMLSAKEIYDTLKSINKLTAAVAVFGLMMEIWAYEHVHSNNNEPNRASRLCDLVVLLSTLTMPGLLTYAFWLRQQRTNANRVRYLVQNHGWRIYKYPGFVSLCGEIFLCSLHCPLGYDDTFHVVAMGQKHGPYTAHGFFSVVMLGRLYLLQRVIVDWTGFNNYRYQFLSAMNNIRVDTSFAMKAFLSSHPFLCTSTYILFITLSLAHAIRVAERPQNIEFEYYWNSVWLVLITMTTVGYGDLYPVTHTGRFMAIVACISNLLVAAMMVVAVTEMATFSTKERTIFELGTRNYIRQRIRDSACRLIQASWKTFILDRRVRRSRGKQPCRMRCIVELYQAHISQQLAIRHWRKSIGLKRNQIFSQDTKVNSDTLFNLAQFVAIQNTMSTLVGRVSSSLAAIEDIHSTVCSMAMKARRRRKKIIADTAVVVDYDTESDTEDDMPDTTPLTSAAAPAIRGPEHPPSIAPPHDANAVVELVPLPTSLSTEARVQDPKTAGPGPPNPRAGVKPIATEDSVEIGVLDLGDEPVGAAAFWEMRRDMDDMRAQMSEVRESQKELTSALTLLLSRMNDSERSRQEAVDIASSALRAVEGMKDELGAVHRQQAANGDEMKKLFETAVHLQDAARSIPKQFQTLTGLLVPASNAFAPPASAPRPGGHPHSFPAKPVPASPIPPLTAHQRPASMPPSTVSQHTVPGQVNEGVLQHTHHQHPLSPAAHAASAALGGSGVGYTHRLPVRPPPDILLGPKGASLETQAGHHGSSPNSRLHRSSPSQKYIIPARGSAEQEHLRRDDDTASVTRRTSLSDSR
eukprot:Rmarinus@m.5366